jgi:potassium channel subfamily K protein 2/potassium channel subfamily K protein 4
VALGYGHIAPKTTAGKMFCIVYALIGIPILLIFMAKMGDMMAGAFRWMYR